MNAYTHAENGASNHILQKSGMQFIETYLDKDGVLWNWWQMETIHKSNVPYYLRNGSLYSALDDDENGPFEVPSECFKSSLQMNSLEDLRFVLRSLRYWGVIEFPQEVYRYMFLYVDRPVVERLKMREFSEFENQLNGISAMLAVPEKDVDRQRLVTSFNIYDTLQSVNGPMDAAVVCDFGLEMVKWLHQPLMKHLHVTSKWLKW